MSDQSHTLTRRTLLQAVGTLAGVATAQTALAQEGEISVALHPSADTVQPTAEPTIDLVVEGADAGVAAFDINVTASGGTVSITDVELQKEPLFEQVTHTDDSLSIEVAQGDDIYEPADEIVLATISLAAESSGTTTVSIDDAAVSDEDNDQYEITSLVDASIDVEGTDDEDDSDDDTEDDPDDEDETDDDTEDDPDDEDETDDEGGEEDETDDTDDGSGDETGDYSGGADDSGGEAGGVADGADTDTDSEEQTDADSDEADADGSSDDSGPGFGIVSAIAGLGAAGYALGKTDRD